MSLGPACESGRGLEKICRESGRLSSRDGRDRLLGRDLRLLLPSAARLLRVRGRKIEGRKWELVRLERLSGSSV